MSIAAKSQLVVSIEPLEGSSETANLAAGQLVEVLADTFPVVTPTNESIQRRPAKNSLSKLQPIPGGREGSLNVQVEMAGPKLADPTTWSNTDYPSFAQLLQACGMRALRGWRCYTLSNVTAWHGEDGKFTTNVAVDIAESDAGLHPHGGQFWKVFGDSIAGEDNYLHLYNPWYNVPVTPAPEAAALRFIITGGGTMTTADPTGTHAGENGATVNNFAPCIIYAPYDDEVSDLHYDNSTDYGSTSGTFQVDELVASSRGGGAQESYASVVGGKLDTSLLLQDETPSEDDGTFRDAPLKVRMLTGSPPFVDGDVIVGEDSSATCQLTDGVAVTLFGSAIGTGNPVFQEDVPSLTLQTRHNGPMLAIKGARGNWTLDVKNRDRPMFTFEMRGCGITPDDDDNFDFGSGTVNQIPPVTVGSNLLVDGTFSPLYGEMSYSSNNELTLRESPTDSSNSGYLSTRIVDRAPSVTIESEAVRAAIFDAWTKHYDKSQVRIVQKLLSATPGNSFEVRSRGVAIDELAPTDKDGILGQQSTFSLNTSASAPRGELFNDECIIIQY